MNQADAKKLAKTLTWCVDPRFEYAGAPTSEEFEQFERDFGVKLPNSYKAFLRVFGPGELAEVFAIHCLGCGHPNLDLAKRTLQHREMFRRGGVGHRAFADPDKVSRLIIFASTYRGERYGWDPQDVTNSRKHEYGVYLIERHVEEVTRIADTFGEFITGFCLGDSFLPYTVDDPREKCYEPMSLRAKRKPKRKSAGRRKPTRKRK